jgi:adenine phosphoribosyltransferase
MDISRFIRDVPDFPKPGILFRDITPLLADGEAFKYVTEQLSKVAVTQGAEAIVGIESRGFIFGAPVAVALKLPFIPVRKPGKLPGERVSLQYTLEYGQSQLDIHKDAISRNQKVLIVDDLLATGGTAHAAAKLVELVGGVVAGLAMLIELENLKGREVLKGYHVESLLSMPG